MISTFTKERKSWIKLKYIFFGVYNFPCGKFSCGQFSVTCSVHKNEKDKDLFSAGSIWSVSWFHSYQNYQHAIACWTILARRINKTVTIVGTLSHVKQREFDFLNRVHTSNYRKNYLGAASSNGVCTTSFNTSTTVAPSSFESQCMRSEPVFFSIRYIAPKALWANKKMCRNCRNEENTFWSMKISCRYLQIT